METNYGIFFNGLASTPSQIGLIDWNNNDIICRINIIGNTGKEIRADYEKKKKLLENKYKDILPKNKNL